MLRHPPFSWTFTFVEYWFSCEPTYKVIGAVKVDLTGDEMDHTEWCERFLREIERASASTVLPFVYVAGGVFDGHYAVVIYRERPEFSPSGRVYEAAREMEMFDPSTPEDVAHAAVAGDITDPSGIGDLHSWPWAEQLAGTSEPIGWHGPLPVGR